MKLTFSPAGLVSEAEYRQFADGAAQALEQVDQNRYPSDMLGWVDVSRWAGEELLGQVGALAREIRESAEVFVVVGLGGSNQGARAVIEALDHCRASAAGKKTEILYAGLNLSPAYYEQLFEQIGDRSVYINVIAKNFKTLEPGVAFRILRDYLYKRYPAQEAARRIITTCTVGDGELHALSLAQGYRFLPFPEDVGGRYSVFTPVGLLPIAVAGIDVQALLAGARKAQRSYLSGGRLAKDAKRYALARGLLLGKGYDVEVLAFFEPALESLGRWWRQLFGESEGKGQTGIFPAVCRYSEDLHSMGQYMQQGKRQMLETFLDFTHSGHGSLPIPPSAFEDGFEYLDGRTLDWVNRQALEATVKAHAEGGVPCFILTMEELTPHAVGELLYFFFIACYYSSVLLGVDPFDQPGVENYKTEMFKLLKQ